MSSSRYVSQIFWRMIFAWAVGCLVAYAIARSGVLALSLREVGILSLASGGVTLLALLPFSAKVRGLVLGNAGTKETENQMGLFVAFLIGMGIRIAGTVALFLACRYQMGASDREIAAVVLIWYVYLAAIEIVSLLKANVPRGLSSTAS